MPVSPLSSSSSSTPVWYCPSRWLMAHHDPQANVHTWSSHMCLADLNSDGENLLTLVDFKRRADRAVEAATATAKPASDSLPQPEPPYDCRLRAYRGQQLIYNHFLDDLPACLVATSIRCPPTGGAGADFNRDRRHVGVRLQPSPLPLPQEAGSFGERPLLALAINDDVYFYDKLKPFQKLSLEDEDCIVDSLNRSEYDVWQMVRQNKADVETMRELLISVSNEFGPNELTSHSNNFLALASSEQRKNYLALWKFKRLNNGLGEHLMSMDTICCSAARLKYSSNITRSGDFGQTRETANFLNNARWKQILDIQRDGLVLGTEDRHLLIYELCANARASLEAHYRLPSTPDHILVERCSPAQFDQRAELQSLTYRILVSCRNCRIYSIDQNYLITGKGNKSENMSKDTKKRFKELLALKCNVLEMCWAGEDKGIGSSSSLAAPGQQQNFVVACLDRRVYCFSSRTGHCKWVVELELPISCIVSLPTQKGAGASADGESAGSLVGVASQASRIDFYVSSTGRIVDSIYLADGYCQAMTFGRFGREDNCLCMTTNSGHLLIFILKRTAKFAHGQCLSSSASHAAEALSRCSRLHVSSNSQAQAVDQKGKQAEGQNVEEENNRAKKNKSNLKLDQPVGLPSAFSLTKSNVQSPADQVLEQLLKADHNCQQSTIVKSTLDEHLVAPQLQIPAKSRDFVDQIVDQARHSSAMTRVFTEHMVKLKDRIGTTFEQQRDLAQDALHEDGNRVTLMRVTGLGNTYRATLSLRLNLKRYAAMLTIPSTDSTRNHLLSACPSTLVEATTATTTTTTTNSNSGQVKAKPECESINSSEVLLANSNATLNVFLSGPANTHSTMATASSGSSQPTNGGANQLSHRCYLVKPFKFELELEFWPEASQADVGRAKNQWIFEKTIEFKLSVSNTAQPVNSGKSSGGSGVAANQTLPEAESVSLNVYVVLKTAQSAANSSHSSQDNKPTTGDGLKAITASRFEPVFISSVNIPTC